MPLTAEGKEELNPQPGPLISEQWGGKPGGTTGLHDPFNSSSQASIMPARKNTLATSGLKGWEDVSLQLGHGPVEWQFAGVPQHQLVRIHTDLDADAEE